MAPVTLTPAQLTRLRQRPHRTRVWLSVFQPGTVLAARINMPAITKGSRDITIQVLSGDVFSVNRGMTCYIGTTPGGQDLGRIRAIDCTPTTLTIAENATAWVNGWYLTVVEYYEPWAVFPRIVLDQSNVPTFYKDYDIPYTNQNQFMDPVVNMGPNHAGFLASGAHSVYYSSSGTFTPDDLSTPTGLHSWVFEGGVPSASFAVDPGYVGYTGAGHFLTSLSVVGNNGAIFTGHRHVSIYTRPDEGPRPPILRWSLQSFEGSREGGGYAVRLSVHERADFSKVVDGALVVLFTDDWEGGVAGKKAAGAENRDSILFVGYIEDDTIRLSPSDNFLEFNVRSITGIAERLATYSTALDSKVGAATWTDMRDMTVDKGVIHFLRWHSTLLGIADFSPTGNRLDVNFLDFSRGNLAEAISGLYQSALLGQFVADRQGKMWAEIDGSLTPTGTARLTALGAGLRLTRQDWRDSVAFNRFGPFQPLAYIELGGIGSGGPATGTIGAYLGGAPGDVAGYYGSVERAQGLVLAGQDQLNILVGNAYARANAFYPEIDIPMAGDYRIVDIAPQSRLLLDLTAAENYRGLVWNGKAFLPQSISYDYREEDQALMMTLRAREETAGTPGTTITIPIDPPYDEWDIPSWDFQFPPIQPFPGLFPPIAPPPATGDFVYALINGLIGRTRNFFDASPHWEAVGMSGITGSMTSDWSFLVLDPADPTNIALAGSLVGGAGDSQGPRIYSTHNLSATGTPGPVWAEVWGQTQNEFLDATSFQRQILATPEKRADGQWHFPFGRRSLAGIPVYVHGAAGAWTMVDIGTTAHNYQSNHWANLAQVGSTIYWVSNSRMWQSGNPDQPSAWVIKRTTVGGDIAWGVFCPSGNPNEVLWEEGLATPDEWKYSNQAGAGSPSTIEIYGPAGGLYEAIPGSGGFETIRQIPGIPGVYYMFVQKFNGSGPAAMFGVFSPGAGFTPRATFTAASVGPVSVMPNNSQYLASFGRTAASGARIMGSQDGGYTWYDKTGDWATQVGVIGDGSSYKSIAFAFTV